ncbi:YifB family Mg chelatase-like AAA ATPase [Plebeiibacterium marinum]|uniref:YifB family Mg chelatase-like AAA ATPase n=1 Tax=Plebeiibacterium marinum TaxID=2992111 RepID=A0AAE3SI78_9BACT|nr:YifB family Mg chelatase-like AAA ATPase [Plebeiobacterium marinum]MCW3804440.1 YifB family Mg chelatase-like AAA ATPase [Plebeiobacterium marinum]
MLVKTYAATVTGIDAVTITIEVNLSQGIKFFLVGLPDNAVKESQQRMQSALNVSKFKWPGKKIVINMAPADIRKEGSSYDLPLAIGILAASNQISGENLSKYMMMGELSLDGSLQPVKGILPIAIRAKEEGFKGIILPIQNAREAAVVEGIEVYGMENITEVAGFLNEDLDASPIKVNTETEFYKQQLNNDLDFIDVKGQESVKRALEIAAAGGHNLIMIGPPGAGKSMIAKRLPSILPPLTLNEALETTKIHSVAGKIQNDTSLITQRPFRSPHHTISDVALVGGGSFPQPGEISLAHHGVLFLDELPEFKRTVLEVMRQPLEDRVISISRARFSVDYPASFMLVSSMNPCPCGYFNHPEKKCVCSPGVVQKYLSKISGPLLDRIDIQIEVVPVPFKELSNATTSEKSLNIRERVIKARKIQENRYKNEEKIHCNAQMTSKLQRKYAQPEDNAMNILKHAMEKLDLSARAYDRILKVARTIADLDEQEQIQSHHMAEAVNYRNLDKAGWLG